MAFFCSGVSPLFTIAATEGSRSRRFFADALGALRFGAIAAASRRRVRTTVDVDARARHSRLI